MWTRCKIAVEPKDNRIYVYHPITDEVIASNNLSLKVPRIARDQEKKCYSGETIFSIAVKFELIGKDKDKLVPAIFNGCIVTKKNVSVYEKAEVIYLLKMWGETIKRYPKSDINNFIEQNL